MRRPGRPAAEEPQHRTQRRVDVHPRRSPRPTAPRWRHGSRRSSCAPTRRSATSGRCSTRTRRLSAAPGTGPPDGVLEDFEDGIGDWDTWSDESVFGGPTFDWESSTDLPPGNKPAGSDGVGVRAGAATRAPAPVTPGDYSRRRLHDQPGDHRRPGRRRRRATAGLRPQRRDRARLRRRHGPGQRRTAAPFETVPAAAYVFNEPSVLATAAAGNTNPLAGAGRLHRHRRRRRSSATGARRSSTSTELGVAIGDTIKVRFAVGRDGCGGVFGWWVDNVKVTTCKVLAASTTAAVHVPEPSTFGSASSINVTVSGGSGTPTGSGHRQGGRHHHRHGHPRRCRQGHGGAASVDAGRSAQPDRHLRG